MKIICIGRNYVKHISELGNEMPTEPVFFLKPDTAFLRDGGDFFIPDFSEEIHYEIELVLRICKEGKHIEPTFAGRYFDAVGVGIDFTARDIQDRQKAKGLPWEPAKAFDHSAAVGGFIPVHELPSGPLKFRLDISGKTVQESDSTHMIHSFERIISYVSGFITLRKGDLVFTGTPAGVGPVKPGDVLTGFLNDRKLLNIRIR